MKTVLSFLVGTLVPITFAGQPLFDKAYSLPGDTLNNGGIMMRIAEADNADLLFSSYHTLENGPLNLPIVLLHRTGPDGSIQWRRKISQSTGQYLRTWDLQELSAGTIGLFGHCGPAAVHATYIEADVNGWPIGAHRYQAGVYNSEVLAAAQRADGTLVLAGSTDHGGNRKGMIMLASPDGTVITPSKIPFNTTYSGFSAIEPCADGGYLLSGTGIRVVNPDTSLKSVVVAKVDSMGTVQWAGKYEEATPSALFYTLGASEIPGVGFRIFCETNKVGTPHRDIVVMAVDYTGDIQWQKRIWFQPYYAGFPLAVLMEKDPMHYWLAAGYSDLGRGSAVMDTSGTILSAYASGANTGNWDYHAIPASDGTLVSITVGPDPNAAGLLVPKLTKDMVIPNTCSPVVLTHSTTVADFTFETTWSQTPLVMTITDILPDLVTIAEVPDVFTQCISTSQEEVGTAAEPRILLDPANGRVTIRGEGIELVGLIDASGRWVHQAQHAGVNECTVDLSGRGPGIYVVWVKTQDGAVAHKLPWY
ncbi:MAG: hypothetical protein WAU70_10140 [Flavobacteriales bacterium]